MKRGGQLKRTTPLKQGKPLARGSSVLKASKPMSRGSSTPLQRTPIERSQSTLARATKPMRGRSKTNSDPRPKTGEAELCRGQPCYLLVPGILEHPGETVVPCHSNQNRHGKSMGMKAHDRYTVPGCMHCHHAIDQSGQFTRAEKFALWDAAFARWEIARARLIKSRDEDSPSSVSVAP